MNPHVSWTRRADQRYTVALKGEEDVGVVQEDRADVMRRLQVAFPDALDVVVLNYYVGFKKRQVSTLYESTSIGRTQRIRTS